MRTRTGWRRLVSAVLAAVAVLTITAGAAHAAYDPQDPGQKAQYDAALSLAAEGYQYGAPLLDTQRTFATSTSVSETNGRGGGPINQFNDFVRLADAKDRTVVAPNADTLYSMAWLDLSRQPQVIHTQKGTKRFHVLELLSPYTENFANVGPSRTAHPDGDYLVTGPGYRGPVPHGLTVIRSPYDRVWIIGRTYVAGPADLAATRRTMKTYKLTPLNRWNPRRPYAYRPPAPAKADHTIDTAVVPGTGPGADPLRFFDALGDALRRFPPPRADAPILGRLKTLGIGPGIHPSQDTKLTDAQRQAMRDAVTAGPARGKAALVTRYLGAFDQHNGWVVTRTGRYGTDYATRALADQFGLGAPVSEIALYPFALLDRDRQALTGAQRYVAHFAAPYAHPPVKFFWSLTMYDGDGFFVDNPLNRYLLNNRSPLRDNADGSLDVYVQPDPPTDPAQLANWLPSPKAAAATPGFRVMVRLYGLSASGIAGVVDGTGWRPPTVRSCGADNRTSDGLACAS